ncbi:MAG: NAD(P)H-binding protein [Myxococcota bacterium]
MSQPTLLVTGASGQLGRAVTSHLLDTLGVPASSLILLTRSPDKLDAPAGAQLRRADFDAPATLGPAFAGADRVLLISTTAIGRRATQHQAAIEAAKAAGAQHLVYTSMPDPHDSEVSFAPEHAATERAIEASGLSGTSILRNHWYFENLHLTVPGMLAAGGKWFTAAGAGRMADVSRDDLALAAATALVKDTGHSVRTLSGAEALTTEEVAAKLGAALGTPLEVVHLEVEPLVAGMIEAGLPEPVARTFASFDTNTAAGHMAGVTGELEALIGRPAQRFDAWLADHAASLRG